MKGTMASSERPGQTSAKTSEYYSHTSPLNPESKPGTYREMVRISEPKVVRDEYNKTKNRKAGQGRSEAEIVHAKYPHLVPVICNKANGSSIPETDKKKYLVPKDLTVGQFHYVIRKRTKLAPERNLVLTCSNSIPPITDLISKLYEELKDEDGFLYMEYND